MMRPRCGTGGDKSGRLYFCRPISRHGNHFYPQSLSRSTSLISAVTVALSHSCWPCLSADACSSDPGSLSLSLSESISVPPASLGPAYLLSLIARREISQRPRAERLSKSCFSCFTCFISSFLCVCFYVFFPPTDLEQLSNRTGSSALTITSKVWEDF